MKNGQEHLGTIAKSTKNMRFLQVTTVHGRKTGKSGQLKLALNGTYHDEWSWSMMNQIALQCWK